MFEEQGIRITGHAVEKERDLQFEKDFQDKMMQNLEAKLMAMRRDKNSLIIAEDPLPKECSPSDAQD